MSPQKGTTLGPLGTFINIFMIRTLYYRTLVLDEVFLFQVRVSRWADRAAPRQHEI